mgnify:CR=1 FL=1
MYLSVRKQKGRHSNRALPRADLKTLMQNKEIGMTDLKEHIIEPKMYSLKHWLRERDLSRSTFYELQKDGLAPKITKVGKINKNFISKKDSDIWDQAVGI